jgi:hypothetical protein
MKKLLKLKEWLTVPDVAQHLSLLFREEVSEADVLRFALDGHLTLSVDFVNGAQARLGNILPLKDAKIRTMPDIDGTPVEFLDGIDLGDGRVLKCEKAVLSINGVWDLVMVGAERLDVEHRYQELTNGPAVNLGNLDGPLVAREEVGCQLVCRFRDAPIQDQLNLKKFLGKESLKLPIRDPANYYPADSLPDDCVLVVRTAALRDLEARLSEADKPKKRPIERRERETLLVIIAALARLPKIDVTHPSKAAAAIESETIGMTARVAKRTIEEHLKRIPDAIESKSQN